MSSAPAFTRAMTASGSAPVMTARSKPAESAFSLPTMQTDRASASAVSRAAWSSASTAWLTAFILPSSMVTTATPSSMVVVTVMPMVYTGATSASEAEDPVEPRELEGRPGGRADVGEHDLAAGLPHAEQDADEHAEGRLVEHGGAGQVDPQRAARVGVDRHLEPRPHERRGREVEVLGQGDV